MGDVVTMEAVDIMAADMATLAGEVSIWGFTVHLTTIMAMAPLLLRSRLQLSSGYYDQWGYWHPSPACYPY